jgi:hypothetical protein
VEKYKKHIADNPDVEMVHVSLDKSEDPAEEWAAKEGFPWPTILPDKVDRSEMRDYKTTGFVPEYHLIDADGKTVVAGASNSAGAFAKIAEMADK